MATLYAVNAAAVNSVPSQKARPGEQSGESFVMYDEIVLAADLNSGDIVLVGGPIPQGARIIAAVIGGPALGGSCALSLGTAAVPQSLIAAASAAAAFRALTTAGAPDAFTKIAQSNQYQVTANAASVGATGKKISVFIEYLVV